MSPSHLSPPFSVSSLSSRSSSFLRPPLSFSRFVSSPAPCAPPLQPPMHAAHALLTSVRLSFWLLYQDEEAPEVEVVPCLPEDEACGEGSTCMATSPFNGRVDVVPPPLLLPPVELDAALHAVEGVVERPRRPPAPGATPAPRCAVACRTFDRNPRQRMRRDCICAGVCGLVALGLSIGGRAISKGVCSAGVSCVRCARVCVGCAVTGSQGGDFFPGPRQKYGPQKQALATSSTQAVC